MSHTELEVAHRFELHSLRLQYKCTTNCSMCLYQPVMELSWDHIEHLAVVSVSTLMLAVMSAYTRHCQKLIPGH